MFSSKKIILFLTKSKLKIVSVVLGNNPKERIIKEFEWNKDTLPTILLQNKTIIGTTTRLLVSDDFVYVVRFTLPKTKEVTRETIRQLAQEEIPQDLNETEWDFKTTTLPDQTESVQVIAQVKDYFKHLSSAFTQAGIVVEAIEPLSYALARFTKSEKNVFLFVYIFEEILLVLSEIGIVIATQRLSSLSKQQIDEFIAFCKKRYSKTPQELVFCGNAQEVNIEQYKTDEYSVTVQTVSPFVSLAFKQDLKGKDEDSLRLVLPKLSPDQTPPSSHPHADKNPPPKHHSLKRFVLGIGLLVFFSGVVLFNTLYKTTQKKHMQNKTSIPQSMLKPSETPQPTVEKARYTLTILNGSGKTGQATSLSDFLEIKGFTVTKTGNAANPDFSKTEIHYKKAVPSEIKLDLDKTLKTLYDDIEEKVLAENFETDILIVIGNNTK